MTQKTYELDSIRIMQKKLEILLAGKLRKKASINQAIETQDRISEKSGSWEGSKEVRKWREKR